MPTYSYKKWSHKLNSAWSQLDTKYYISNKYIPAIGLQYRFRFILSPTFDGMYYVRVKLWLETPSNRNDILNSPFVQYFQIPIFCMGGNSGYGAAWYITEKNIQVIDGPTFEIQDPVFEYPLLDDGMVSAEDVRKGTCDPSSGSGWVYDDIDVTYQSTQYLIQVPADSRLRILSRTATCTVSFGAAPLSVRTYPSIAKRIAIAKDKERRLHQADDSSGQVEVKLAINDTIKPTSRSALAVNPYKTRTSSKKENSGIVTDNRGNVGVVYQDSTGVHYISSHSHKIGEASVNVTWPGYSYIVPACAPRKERPEGFAGIYTSLLCYRRLFKSYSPLVDAYISGTTLYTQNPWFFEVGPAAISDGRGLTQVYIKSINDLYNLNGQLKPVHFDEDGDTVRASITLESEIPKQYLKGSLLVQDRLSGLITPPIMTVLLSTTGPRLSYSDLCVRVVNTGIAPRGIVPIGNGTSYVFVQEYITTGGYAFRVVVTSGETRQAIIGGKVVAVDNVPEKSVLVAVVTNGVVSNIPNGSVLAYKVADEFVGCLIDNTGRVSSIFHNTKEQEIAAYSENFGTTWVWSRVG